MKILIVEDAVCMARAFESVLKDKGHDVLCVVEFQSLEPLVAVTLNKERVAIDPASFDMALVDGQLVFEVGDRAVSCEHQGPAIVKALTQGNLVCVGISSNHGVNGELIEHGASAAVQKSIALYAFLKGIMNPQESISPSTELTRQLEQLESEFLTDEFKQERKQLDALVMQYLKN